MEPMIKQLTLQKTEAIYSITQAYKTVGIQYKCMQLC